jgi:hypothetical protein
MANDQLYKDTPIAPQSLSGKNHLDIDLTGKRYVEFQFKTTDAHSAYRLHFRCDETPTAGGATVPLLAPEGYLGAGGCEAVWVDPDSTETPTLHLLLTDGADAPQNGSAGDDVYFLASRARPDA